MPFHELAENALNQIYILPRKCSYNWNDLRFGDGRRAEVTVTTDASPEALRGWIRQAGGRVIAAKKIAWEKWHVIFTVEE